LIGAIVPVSYTAYGGPSQLVYIVGYDVSNALQSTAPEPVVGY
jgi:hypothetical protein